MKIFNKSLLKYQLSAVDGWVNQMKACPVCTGSKVTPIDRKGLHKLYECMNCHLLYRHPREDAEEMHKFYQHEYDIDGLATYLPNEQELEHYLDSGFIESKKDFSWHIKILESLGMKPGLDMLEFGSSWGYATWQFKKAGFNVDAYELSVPRAAYGKKLGVDIETDIEKIEGPYDFIYSCHVLEHVPNPKEILIQQMAWLKPGGMLVAHTPNGSLQHRLSNKKGFHKSWGLVHPVLLTDEFIQNLFASESLYISSDDRPESICQWGGDTRVVDDCDADGLFFVIRKEK